MNLRVMNIQTDEQKKDEERLLAYIQREGLVSMMNATKWRELKNSMLILKEKAPEFRVVCLRSKTFENNNWQRDWQSHLPNFKYIEYLEINPLYKIRKGLLVEDTVDTTSLIKELLKKNNIPFSLEGEYIRIYGYVFSHHHISFYEE